MTSTERAFYDYTQAEAQLTNALEHAPTLPFTMLSREAQSRWEAWQAAKRLEEERENDRAATTYNQR